ncbi:uba ts-n domain containing protein [Niveomyces insectorum RCEF 264]|uniref:Uba ts-n domain containing protein n=1 Tax=Niveomyces insectorum RCEF 264 TaxID=1081102 RepID=A0A167XA79_9HYPO|nr:uba ts-n domain containing protein [Niveomyces insectorum RCEF 264]
MDDLSGLDWSSSNNSAGTNKSATKPTTSSQPPFAASGFASYPSLRPTPSPFASGRSTPVSAQGSGTSAGINLGARPSQAAAAKPAQDSFSGLFQGGASKNPANLSLRERQELLEAEKRKKAEEVRKQQQENYGDGQFFDVLGRGSAGASRSGSPAIAPPAAAGNGNNSNNNNDDDLFAAFNADTKVDNASHFPPPAANGSGKSTPANAPPPGLDLSNPSAWGRPSTTSPSGLARNGAANEDDDDDPFGLNRLQARTGPAAPPAVVEDRGGDDDEVEDDLLGDLGRPVDEVRRKTEAQRRQTAQSTRRPQPEAGKPIEDSDSDSTTSSVANDNGVAKTGNEPFDRAVAQLVDYGFSPENARRGLTEGGAGLNVQAAVNWLLDDAHRQAKEKALGKTGGGRSGSGEGAGPFKPPNEGRTTSRSRNTGDGGPAWMREADGGHAPSRGDGRSSSAALAEGDFAKTAAAMGSNFLKTANSLWKTGQKQLQKAVQDFQQDADPNQPKWMRSAGQEHMDAPAAPDGGAAARRRDAAASAAAAVAATEEAMMLESRPERRSAGTSAPRSRPDEPPLKSSRNPDAGLASRTGSVPRWQQQSSADPRARLTKQALEAEIAQAYVSPSRRRKAPAAAPAASEPPPSRQPAAPASQSEGDLLSNSTALPQRPAPSRGGSNDSAARFSPRAAPNPRSLSAQQPPPPKVARQVPPVNPYVLQTSAKHRADGAAHVKRGDYAAAHAAYSSALSAGIPDSHPLLAVLFCNRALTALKTGEPRQAVADADAALAVIGPGRGEGESVALEDGTGAARGMKELYGKALMRKAEALEQMERWAEAGPVWQQCVESGVGGATAVAGRQRGQTALAPKTTKPSTPKPATPKPPTPRPSGPRPSNGLSPAFASSSASAAVPTSSTGRDFAAVERLRAANEAAAQEDAAKLALLDKVDARVASWRDGKKDNLRALLGSMELVLWEGSGWKKVGLHELVMPNKVKVVYMKAIGKTHPDKLPQDASTEIRMIAGMVFSTLNESWDKFKADNKM